MVFIKYNKLRLIKIKFRKWLEWQLLYIYCCHSDLFYFFIYFKKLAFLKTFLKKLEVRIFKILRGSSDFFKKLEVRIFKILKFCEEVRIFKILKFCEEVRIF